MHLTFILFIIVLLESVFAYYSTECITLFTFLIVIKHVDIHFLENKDSKSSLQCALLVEIVKIFLILIRNCKVDQDYQLCQSPRLDKEKEWT